MGAAGRGGCEQGNGYRFVYKGLSVSEMKESPNGAGELATLRLRAGAGKINLGNVR